MFFAILFAVVAVNAQSFYSVQPEGAGTIIDSTFDYIYVTDTLYDTVYVYTYDEDSTIIDSTMNITESLLEDTMSLVALTAVANEGYEFINWITTMTYYVEGLEEPIYVQNDTLTEETIFAPTDGVLYDVIEETPVRVDFTAVAYFGVVDGIKDINQITYRVFPNPATTQITISGDVNRIELFDITGKRLMNTNNATLDISNLAIGLYMIRIIDNNNNISTQKVVKK